MKHAQESVTIKDLVLAENPNLRKVASHLEKSATVSYLYHPIQTLIIQLFRERIRHEIISAPPGDVSRSNWTYSVAFAMLDVARTMHLTIRFEAEGKRDAVFEVPTTSGKRGEILMAAEWEWEAGDVFGKDKELDKLFKTCRKSPGAWPLLFTYVDESTYADFLARVAAEWSSYGSEKHQLPLNMCAVIYQNKLKIRQFEYIRTCEIGSAQDITFWEDVSLA